MELLGRYEPQFSVPAESIIPKAQLPLCQTCFLFQYTTNNFPGEYMPTTFDTYASSKIVNSQVVAMVSLPRSCNLMYPKVDHTLDSVRYTWTGGLWEAQVRIKPSLIILSENVPQGLHIPRHRCLHHLLCYQQSFKVKCCELSVSRVMCW